MTNSPRAGQPAAPDRARRRRRPHRGVLRRQARPVGPRSQRVAFGTSGHRGSALHARVQRAHILAITQAICRLPRARRASTARCSSAATPTRCPSRRSAPRSRCWRERRRRPRRRRRRLHADAGGLARHPRREPRPRRRGLADGIVVTPSHNPPEDGGFKYNPPNGGPADTDVTRWIAGRGQRAPGGAGSEASKACRVPYERARGATARRPRLHGRLRRRSRQRRRHGGDPRRRAAARASIRWAAPASTTGSAIAERYGLDLTVVNPTVDPTFGFMTVDQDGKIRMDCSSPYAMASLVELKDRFDLAFGNDTDADRHGIVTRGAGLMNPNHYLAVGDRTTCSQRRAAGARTPPSARRWSAAVDDRPRRAGPRPAAGRGAGGLQVVRGRPARRLARLRRRGERRRVVPAPRRHRLDDRQGRHHPRLLAAEITAAHRQATRASSTRGSTRAARARRATAGSTRRRRPRRRRCSKKLSPQRRDAPRTLAGEPDRARAHHGAGQRRADRRAEGHRPPNGWFAARPSGTEDVYKIYAESFRGEAHLATVLDEAAAIVAAATG